MGNSIGGRKRVKVMKVDGETLKLRAPVRVCEVLKDYPDHVLLDSEAVKRYGIKAKPLEPQQDLKHKKIYFLVQLPKIAPDPEKERLPRRVRSSGVHMSAKDRLDLLMLSRRTMSEISIARPSPAASSGEPRFNSGPMQVKMKLRRSQVAKLMEESQNEGEVAEKIINMYIKNDDNSGGDISHQQEHEHGQRKPNREKRVSFFPVDEGEIRLAVAANQ